MNRGLAVITGATGGIGQAIAKALHERGHPLLLVGRRESTLRHLAAELCRTGQAAVEIQVCDLTQASDRTALLDRCFTLSGPPALWINNAGVSAFGLFAQQDEARMAELVTVNVSSTLQLTAALLARVNPAQDLQVINIGSTFGSIGYPGFATYAATKFALRGWSEALAREYADSAIRIRYFAPRATRTAINTAAVMALNEELGVHMDEPEVVANALMNFIEGDRQEYLLGWPEKFFAWLNRVFPALVSRALTKQLPIIRMHAAEQHIQA